MAASGPGATPRNRPNSNGAGPAPRKLPLSVVACIAVISPSRSLSSSQVYPRVILVTNGAPAGVRPEGSLLSRTKVYDDSYGYLRVARVATGLADEIKSAHDRLDATNKLKGVVLDLRFADGQDYTAAAN